MKNQIYLLFITIETLDLNYKQELLNLNQEYKVRDINHTRMLYLPTFLQSIFIIYTINQKPYLYKIIIYMIKIYITDMKGPLFIKYLRRFQYIYYRSQDNYEYKSLDKSFNISEIAINNLYIIKNISQANNNYEILKILNNLL